MISLENIYLVGPMGAGKSTVGKQLASILGRKFQDSDREIEKETGLSIEALFRNKEEASFRRHEAQFIAGLIKNRSIILSTGGGTLLQHENRIHLQSTGWIVYLSVSLAWQCQRIQNSGVPRPLLSQSSLTLRDTLNRLNQRRQPLYEDIADMTLNTDGQSPLQIARLILNAFNQRSE